MTVEDTGKSLNEAREACEKCKLYSGCYTPFMAGKGNPKQPTLCIIGEAPGEKEDQRGVPFVGPTGDKLHDLLEAAGITSDDYWITNAVRCRPPNNEIKDAHKKACREFLHDELLRVKPKAILALGNSALFALSGRQGIMSERGRLFHWEGIPCVASFHPAFVLRDPSKEDMLIADTLKIWDIATTGELPTRQAVDYRVARTREDLHELFLEVEEADRVAWDIETTGLDAFAEDAEVVCVQFSTKPHTGWLVPLRHKEGFYELPYTRSELDNAEDLIKWILEESGKPLVGQNLKFDMGYVQANLNIQPRTPAFDCMIAHHLLFENESQSGGNGLKRMAWKFTDMGGYEAGVERAYGGPKDWYKNMRSIPLEAPEGSDPEECLMYYACGDVDVCLRVQDHLQPLLEKENLTELLQLELKLQDLLVSMENHGAAVDWEYHAEMMEAFPAQQKRIAEMLRGFPEVQNTEIEYPKRRAPKKKTVKSVAEDGTKHSVVTEVYQDPEPFNANSPNQVRLLCYDILELPKNDKWINDKTGEYSTKKDVVDSWLAKLPAKCVARDIVELIVKGKRTSKLYGTYIEPLSGLAGRDGKIHTRYNMARAVTSRLTSENPNLMQLPRDDEKIPEGWVGKGNIKRLYVGGKPGWWVNESDYSQIELRIAAMVSQDQLMLDNYDLGQDLHSRTCCGLFGYEYEDLLDRLQEGDKEAGERRTKSKTINFTILYGAGDGQIADKTGTSKREAAKLRMGWFEVYSGFSQWVKETRAHAADYGFVKGLFGHIRHLPNVYANDEGVREEAFRQAVNFVVQNTASKMCAYSEMFASQLMLEDCMESYPFMQVHDSIVSTGPEEEKMPAALLIKEVMENLPFEFLIPGKVYARVPPIKADVKIGPNLRDAKSVKL